MQIVLEYQPGQLLDLTFSIFSDYSESILSKSTLSDAAYSLQSNCLKMLRSGTERYLEICFNTVLVLMCLVTFHRCVMFNCSSSRV